MATGQGYNHVPTSSDYPRGGRSEIDWDWEAGQVVWHDQLANMFLAILQVCLHCLAGRENCFKHSDRLTRHV